ncbi:hypothetical protein [Baaleninema sp.]|uniref:hypothetical protein n=1 Tax=Baaleninema sp. TaxID=3101197 RepID=UPI003D077DEB
MKPTSEKSIPDGDRKLVEFLKQHQAIAPPEPPDLEDRILAALPPRPSRRWRRRWIAPVAVAASLTLAWVGSRSFTSNQPREEELVQLEAFVQQSWYCSVERCEEEIWDTELWDAND